MPDVLLTSAALITAAGRGAAPVLTAMDAAKPMFADLAEPGGLPWPAAVLDPADIPWPAGSRWANMQKYANVSAHAAVAATLLAMDGAEPAEGQDALRSGVVMAVGCSGSDELGDVFGKLAVRARTDPRPLARLLYDEVPDYSYIRGIPSQIGQFVAIATGFRGSNVAIYGEGGAGGLGALALARRLLRSGELDRVIVVGVAPPLAAGILTAYDGEDPLGTEVSPGRGPFDADRAGTLVGQSAVAVVVENAGAAGIFGAPAAPLRLMSCQTLCAPRRADALAYSTREAVGEAAVRPDLWWSHASGSRIADAEAIATVAAQVPALTTSSKGTIGASFECGGLVDVVLAGESMRRALVPPVGLLERPDPAFAGTGADIVTGAPRSLRAASSALVTALSHGAQAATAGAAVLSWEG
jgi:3-oxoacyl-[acyl-carrier-protein] synthase II